MNLFETKEPLVIDHPVGGHRLIAAIFKTPSGICFFDIGWPEIGRHPTHFVDGEIKGEGPWQVGESVIYVMKSKRDKEQWADWLAYMKANDITDKSTQEEFNRLIEEQEGG